MYSYSLNALTICMNLLILRNFFHIERAQSRKYFFETQEQVTRFTTKELFPVVLESLFSAVACYLDFKSQTTSFILMLSSIRVRHNVDQS